MINATTVRRTALAALVATGLPAAAGTAPAAAKAPLCENRPADVLAVSGTHRLLEEFTRSRADADAGVLRVLHCRKGSRTARVLHKATSNLDSSKRVVDGSRFVGPRGRPTLVAYGVRSDGGVTSSGSVYLHRPSGSTGPLATVQDCIVDGFLLTRSGAVVLAGGDIAPGGLTTVDAAGRVVRATTGVADVAVGGDRVYWTAGATTSTVALAGRPSGLVTTPDSCG